MSVAGPLASKSPAEWPSTMTAAEVVDVMQVSPRTVMRWCDDGRLRDVNLGRGAGKRIPRDSLLSLIGEDAA